ncbi:MAG: ABC transporter permease [Leptospiraceae bacterium]|nr:ABC transporter permease [Leptospiraceae bacterium]
MGIVFLITSRYLRGAKIFGLLSLKSRLSFIVMAVGVSLLVIVLSIFNGFQKQVKESLWSGGSHVTIENNYESGEIQNYQKIIDLVLKNKYLKERVVSIQGNITSHGLLQNSTSFIPIMIRAVPMEATSSSDLNFTNLPHLTYYNRDEVRLMNSKNYILIGKEMASLYGYSLGKTITVAVPGGTFTVGKGVEVNVESFRVSGFFRTGYYNYDSRFIFLSLPVAQKLFKLKGSVNQIIIKVKSLDDLVRVKSTLLEIFNDPDFDPEIKVRTSLTVRTIAEEQENFLAALKLEKTIISIIVFLFIVLAALGMVATVYSLVRSKQKSIGTLKALGLSSNSILLIFTLNSMIIGVLASSVGGMIGIFGANQLESIINALSEIINLIGSAIYQSDWRTVELVPKDIYYFDHLPVDIDISFIFMVTTAATILSGIAGYFPARWAARLNPIDTIRNE